MSMAAGEDVSVSSQADTERADLDRERKELAGDSEHERAELTAIYVGRGLDAGLASHVATQLTAHVARGAHERDELVISDISTARPLQAALASAGTFSVGAVLPLVIVLLVPVAALMWAVSGSSLLFLALLGYLAARARRRFCEYGCHAGDLLGRLGNGPDSGSWSSVCGSCLKSRV